MITPEKIAAWQAHQTMMQETAQALRLTNPPLPVVESDNPSLSELMVATGATLRLTEFGAALVARDGTTIARLSIFDWAKAQLLERVELRPTPPRPATAKRRRKAAA